MSFGPPLPPPVLAFSLGPLSGIELFVIAMAALMIFGSRLPEVALRGVAHFMRARRAVARMWRETGLEDELRRVQRDIELNMPRDADFDVKPKSPGALESSSTGIPDPGGASYPRGLDDPADELDPDADRGSEVRIEPAEGIVAADDVWEDDDLDAAPEAPASEPDGEPEPRSGTGA